MKILKIVSIFLTLVGLALITVSFGTSWYRYQNKDFERNIEFNIYYSAKGKINNNFYMDNDGKIGREYRNEFEEWDNDEKHESQLYKTCLALAVIAWVICFISLVLHLFSFFLTSIKEKIPFVRYIERFILILAAIFSFISYIILINRQKARDKDCRCIGDYSFIYKESMVIYGTLFNTWNNIPWIGWDIMVVANFFIIVATIVNFFLFKTSNDNSIKE